MILSQNPVFIVGFPRSGTTLLQSMLATQENVYSFQETHFFCTTMRYIQTDENGFIKLDCLKAVFQNIKEKTEHEFLPEITSEITDLAKAQELSVKKLFEYLVSDLLLKQMKTNKLSEVIWIEKTPGHIFQLDTIHDFYPEAKFIEIIRNPLNAIYSAKTNFHSTNDKTLCALAHRWKRGIEVIRRFEKDHSNRLYSLKYEDLVNNTESEFNKIAKFLNIKPEIMKLKDIEKTARKVILSREVWKNDNLKKGITKINQNYKWPMREKLMVQFLLKAELFEYGYFKSWSLLQVIYNGWMILIAIFVKLEFLNSLKKPVKFLLREVKIWPYQN